jgi:hypothetical protein
MKYSSSFKSLSTKEHLRSQWAQLTSCYKPHFWTLETGPLIFPLPPSGRRVLSFWFLIQRSGPFCDGSLLGMLVHIFIIDFLMFVLPYSSEFSFYWSLPLLVSEPLILVSLLGVCLDVTVPLDLREKVLLTLEIGFSIFLYFLSKNVYSMIWLLVTHWF